MSIRALWNSVKEGLQGILRHPLVLVASVTTILLMLMIISVFTIFSANSRYIMDNIKKQPPIEVYMKIGVSQEEVDIVNEYLQDQMSVTVFSYDFLTPERYYSEFQQTLGENSDVLEGLDYNTFVPYMFRLQLVDPSMVEQVVFDLQGFQGVNRILHEARVMSLLSSITRYVHWGTAGAFAILMIISLFVISNMVRISVYARSEEISIMKYIGATPGYIRLPYILEGVITGLISAACAWGVVYFLYGKLYEGFQSGMGDTIFTLLSAGSLSGMIFVVCVVTGVLIGAFGSAISVRKYIQV